MASNVQEELRERWSCIEFCDASRALRRRNFGQSLSRSACSCKSSWGLDGESSNFNPIKLFRLINLRATALKYTLVQNVITNHVATWLKQAFCSFCLFAAMITTAAEGYCFNKTPNTRTNLREAGKL